MSVNGCTWVKETSQFNEEIIKSYNEESDKRYFLEVDVKYPKQLHGLHNDLTFLSKRMKIENVQKLTITLHDKKENVIHIRNLKQALNHGLVLKKMHRVNKFNQKVRLKSYIGTNTELRKKGKNKFEKIFLN